MPRLARCVIAKVPHYITQHGNRREDVFFTDDDREIYLKWLAQYCHQHAVDILAYCLMPNHVHLVAVPATEAALHGVLKPLHMRYAQRFNRQWNLKGHVWQGRYCSSPLDDVYLWATLRYVERHPVRAGLVQKAEQYPWSSAPAHCLGTEDPVLTANTRWRNRCQIIENWSSWLAEEDEPEHLMVIQRNSQKGLPCGSEPFLQKLEKQVGRRLRFRPQGRPRADWR